MDKQDRSSKWKPSDNSLLLRLKSELPNYDFSKKKIILDSRTKADYEKAINPNVPFGVRVRRFLYANKNNKFGSLFKDLVLIFLPFGRKVDSVTDLIVNQIKRTMPQETKKYSRSKSIVTFGLLFIVGLLGTLNILPQDIPLSPDAYWVSVASGVVGVILRLITGKPITGFEDFTN